MEIINEAVNERKYECPYCEERDTKSNLSIHIEEEHQDLIPVNFTASRIVFNHINKKDSGNCIICRRTTEWNESANKYDRICSPQCKEIFVNNMRKGSIDKYGKPHLLNDPEHQKKMLAQRKISGEYKYSDGTVFTYTGTYELEFLKFMDEVIEAESKDIVMPGPIYKYAFNGQEHTWITDAIYIPYNLVFDIKDGGKNPNTHPNMKIDRDKQVRKEEAITNAKVHNYIRLTDNNFGQLLNTMAELKKTFIAEDKNKHKLIHIYENMALGSISKITDTAYIVPYSRNPYKIEDVAVMKDLMIPSIFTLDENGSIVITSLDMMEDVYYAILEVENADVKTNYERLIKESADGVVVDDPNYLVKLFTNKTVDSLDDVLTMDNVNLVDAGHNLSLVNYEKDIEEIAKYSNSPRPQDGLTDISATVDGLIDGITVYSSQFGVFLECETNNKRTKYYPSMDSIPKHIPFLLRRM